MKKGLKRGVAAFIALLVIGCEIIPNIGAIAAGAGSGSEPDTQDTRVEYNFDNMDLSNMSDWKSTRFEKKSPYAIVEGEQNQAVSKHWFSGTTYPSGLQSGRGNAGLKPNEHDTYWSRLDITDEYENFEMITQMYLYNNEGVVFGKKDVGAIIKALKQE